MNIMFLDEKSVLHLIDTVTCFSAATFLDPRGQSYGQSEYYNSAIRIVGLVKMNTKTLFSLTMLMYLNA